MEALCHLILRQVRATIIKSVVVLKAKTHKRMEQNREARNKPAYLRLIAF